MPQERALIRQNIRMQAMVTVIALVLFGFKFYAWRLTHSMAIYTDALESIVNILSGAFGLYSLYFSARPRDENHPYGHGKMEFIAAAVEGIFITLAGAVIILRVIDRKGAAVLQHLDLGILLILGTGVVNYAVGWIAVRIGTRNTSLPLIASGRHLQTDSYTTLGIVIGLALVYATGYVLLDSVVAVIFALLIVYTGVNIIRQALAGILDEADPALIGEIVATINAQRRANWIDLHNLRIIKYGRVLHIDCHLTVPGNLTVREGHVEQEALAEIIRRKYGNRIEVFAHLDPAEDGAVSTDEDWTVENVLKLHRVRV